MPSMDRLNAIYNENPDSLAQILEEHVNIEGLSDSLRAEYGWWISLVHDRLNRSLVNDTIIHHTLKYFKKMDSERLPVAYLLAAKQTNSNEINIGKEIEYIKQGWRVAIEKRDTTNILKIGSMLSHKLFINDNGKESIEISSHLLRYIKNDPWNEMSKFYDIACCYASLRNIDSMSLYFNRAIKLSRDVKSPMERFYIRNYIDGLNISGKHNEKAASMLKEFNDKFNDRNDMDYLAKSFANICLNLNRGELALARASLDSIKQSGLVSLQNEADNKYRISFPYIYQILRAAYDTKVGMPVNLIDIYLLSELVAQNEERHNMVERERLLTQNRLERNNLLLKIKEENSRMVALYIALGAMVALALLIWIYQRKLLKKECYLRKSEEQVRINIITLHENERKIRENEETILYLSEQLDEQGNLNDKLNERQEEIDRIMSDNEQLLKEKLDIENEIRKLSDSMATNEVEMEAYERLAWQNTLYMASSKRLSLMLISKDEELYNLREGKVKHLSDIDWDSIFSKMDNLFDSYHKRLRKDFPALTDEDVQCCCLIKLQLSTTAISRIFGIAPSSVTKRKQRIRERMSQSRDLLIAKDQPIDVYLWGY